ncbi:hypothetical protein B9479_005133 [Cryptococcus floricola]|uniref:Uncharacterized protein n=1 Tax=Cryptococcus floricola TaxID=2591691 RepID=A0A5D3ARR0_9TREE|nr:hypothetical protein B9479_005133 [Cryptococcus floricola]
MPISDIMFAAALHSLPEEIIRIILEQLIDLSQDDTNLALKLYVTIRIMPYYSARTNYKDWIGVEEA